MPETPNKSYKMAVANDDANILTRLFESNNDEITSSKLSSILRTKLACLLPFLNFKSIRGFDVAVKAVSEPDKKPDKIIRIKRKKMRIKVIKDMSLFN
tara:strand:- start:382 stop:675 length:294 start_codon:yes stop_codon:yes gene_type:complete